MASHPLQFHSVVGSGMELSADRRLVRRFTDEGSGIAFLSQPVMRNETIFLRFGELREYYSHSCIHFGFTSKDPASFCDNPPDRVSKFSVFLPDIKTCPLPYKLISKVKSSLISIQLLESGVVVFSADDMVANGFVDLPDNVLLPLWFVVDFFGQASTVKLIGRRTPRTSSGDGVQQESTTLHYDCDGKCVTCCLAKPSGCSLFSCGHKPLCPDCLRRVYHHIYLFESDWFCPFCRVFKP